MKDMTSGSVVALSPMRDRFDLDAILMLQDSTAKGQGHKDTGLSSSHMHM